MLVLSLIGDGCKTWQLICHTAIAQSPRSVNGRQLAHVLILHACSHRGKFSLRSSDSVSRYAHVRSLQGVASGLRNNHPDIDAEITIPHHASPCLPPCTVLLYIWSLNICIESCTC
eukprot:TRINITY_DN8424_c0_g3_i4.p1 TRINITY_DN8424_c0_g3~~TRINITY_DN8424_c0_g3_i4.p1  ORF type:complete len:116 (-),score=7.37 TRINITY_DN8424_c0_g3_i4:252-599(-)